MMRLFLITVAAVLALNIPPISRAAYSAEPQVVDGVAAVVALGDDKNPAKGEIITYSQVRELVAPREKVLRTQYTGDQLAAKVKEAREAALKDLIDRQLIIQALKKKVIRSPIISWKNNCTTLFAKTSAAIGTLLSRRWKPKISPSANSKRWRLRK
jgi:hypothetical protein